MGLWAIRSGVPDSIRRSLFEPFVTRDKPGGTGLGLAIVKKIVCEHGGRVWEDPWSLKGACFHLALPVGPPGERRGGGRTVPRRGMRCREERNGSASF